MNSEAPLAGYGTHLRKSRDELVAQNEQLQACAGQMREFIIQFSRANPAWKKDANKIIQSDCAQSLFGRLATLEKERDELVTALRFYADAGKWETCVATGDVDATILDGDSMMVFKEGEDHPWSVAKEAILKVSAPPL